MTNYIGSSQDVHLTDKEYLAYLYYIGEFIFCPLCEGNHEKKYIAKCQMPCNPIEEVE